MSQCLGIQWVLFPSFRVLDWQSLVISSQFFVAQLEIAILFIFFPDLIIFMFQFS
jgi:hypothetical protein